MVDVGSVPAVVTGHSDGGGQSWWAIIVIVLALMWGRNGMGGGGAGEAVAVNNIGRELDFVNANMNSRFNQMENQINFNETLAYQRNILDQLCGINRTIDNSTFQIVTGTNNGFCQTQKDIKDLAFQGERNTNVILNAINDQFCGLERRELMRENEALREAGNSARIIYEVVNTLRPTPNPTYSVTPPVAFSPYGGYCGTPLSPYPIVAPFNGGYYGGGYGGNFHNNCCEPKCCC